MTAVVVVFWASASLILYTYAGYPLAIFLLGRLRPRGRRARAVETPEPSVSVLLVVHDEEEMIEAKLRSCLASDYPRDLLEILVVSDGSKDRTEAIVQSFAGEGVRLLSLPGPKGKAAALTQAVPLARGDILVLTDARQSLAANAISQLVTNFADPEIGAASGELKLTAPKGTEKAAGVGAYWKYEKLVRRLESRYDATVGATGALYAVRRELFRPLDPRLILDDVAVPMDVVLAGSRVVFDPGAQAFDHIPEEASRELQRKVRTLAGNLQLVRLRPELLSPGKNRLFWQFVSHKLLRLLVPWLLVLLLGSSILLGLESGGLYRAAAIAEGAFYLLALAGAIAPAKARAVRFVKIPYAFCLLNLAAALAWVSYLRGTERANWKGEPAARLEKKRLGGT